MSAQKTVGELLQEKLDRLGERLEEVESKLAELITCETCHVLFADRDAWDQHECAVRARR